MASPELAASRPLALVVDHDADTREMYVMQLQAEGFAAEEAQNAAQALAKAVATRPDVVTTDLGPGLDGISLCRELKSHHLTRAIPVIVVTGRGLREEVQQALDSGCVSVLLKPCLPNELLAEIRRVLRLTS
jgi:two-component system, cell cycle response regulator DivK